MKRDPNIINKNPLIVLDDEPDILEFLRLILWENGYPIIPVENVDEAIAQIEKHKIGLILSDIRLPGKSGIELLKWVKDKRPEIPIILMSGFADFPRAEAERLGAIKVLSKPLDLKEILALIAQHYVRD